MVSFAKHFSLTAILLLVTGCATSDNAKLTAAAIKAANSKPVDPPGVCVKIMQNYPPRADEPLALTLAEANIAINERNKESLACDRILRTPQ